MKKNRLLRSLILCGWILGILLPMYSLRRLSPSFQSLFDWVFQTHASHVLMHYAEFRIMPSRLPIAA